MQHRLSKDWAVFHILLLKFRGALLVSATRRLSFFEGGEYEGGSLTRQGGGTNKAVLPRVVIA